MRLGRATFGLALGGAALLSAGCRGTGGSSFEMPRVFGKTPASDVKQVGYKDGDDTAAASPAMAAADGLFREEQYEKAEKLFSDIADDTKQRPEVAERARFYHAEALRKQGYYPKAVDAYHKLLLDFPSGVYRGQAVGQMYAIAMEWLQPARDELLAAAKPDAPKPKKSWTEHVIPVNFDRKLPTMDAEGRALQTLDRVYFNDPSGPFADKALFTLGQVNYLRNNYREASRYFQQLVETNDKSPLRDEALQLAIVTKNNSTGGPLYDGRDTAEAMRLINMAKATSPKLANENSKLLDQQAVAVRYQQAEKDYETAEFYRRTGHPGSAWFYYELVIRRYPGIGTFAETAAVRQRELKVESDELSDPSAGTSSKWVWKKYVLGHQQPVVKAAPETPDMKELPTTRPAPVVPAGQANIPQDIRPRQ